MRCGRRLILRVSVKERKANTVEYYEVAMIQLEEAIKLYEEDNYICAITLAKASEEFIGKHLPINERSRSKLKFLVKDKYGIDSSEINRVANFFKHGNDSELLKQEIPIKISAVQYIAMALSNYLSFTGNVTQKMLSFAEAHTHEKVDLMIAENEKVA